MKESLGFTVIEMSKIAEGVKSKLGSEEEPFEGEVPLVEVEKEIKSIISQGGKSAKFLFDNFTHESADHFVSFSSQFGSPEFLLFLSCDEKHLKDRWCKKNEAEEFPEEQLEVLKAD